MSRPGLRKLCLSHPGLAEHDSWRITVPLTQPVSRELAHTRVVTCHGYRREDDLWDIEGRIVDTKPYRFQNRDRGGWIEADEALHDMSIRLTINLDLEVIDVDAVIDHSPYNYCKSISSIARNLDPEIETGHGSESRLHPPDRAAGPGSDHRHSNDRQREVEAEWQQVPAQVERFSR
jgi:hypothetical protein